MKSKTSSPTSERRARLRVGLKDVDRATFAAAVSERLGKQRVSIMLDSAIIEFFKVKAGERGYQTMINQALHQAMHKNSSKQHSAILSVKSFMRLPRACP